MRAGDAGRGGPPAVPPSGGLRAGVALLVWGVAIALSGCATSEYHVIQQDWTRSQQSYFEFEGQAFVHATLKSDAFREAYVSEYTRLFALTAEQGEALAEAERDEAATTIVVVAAFYTASIHWNDLDPARGIWEVRLEGPGATSVARPRRVNRLPPRDPAWRHFYPFTDPHFTLYELRFDRHGDDGAPLIRSGQPLSLVIAGAPAQLRLTWAIP